MKSAKNEKRTRVVRWVPRPAKEIRLIGSLLRSSYLKLIDDTPLDKKERDFLSNTLRRWSAGEDLRSDFFVPSAKRGRSATLHRDAWLISWYRARIKSGEKAIVARKEVARVFKVKDESVRKIIRNKK